jgi:hypothetical protein
MQGVLLCAYIGGGWGQIAPGVDFAAMIRTPAGIQKSLDRCDGHLDFEKALANWLERAEPASPTEQRAVRETTIRLLEDTTDQQVALALSDGLLRHALQDLKREPSIVPKDLARGVYADLRKAAKDQTYKKRAMMVALHGIAADGTGRQRATGFFPRGVLHAGAARSFGGAVFVAAFEEVRGRGATAGRGRGDEGR